MYKKYVKRFFDIIVSFFTLILLSPIYFVIGITIKIIDNGKIFYTQERTGENGNNFKIYKFKTMCNGSETKLGKFLRNSSLDELPQFYNVLKGDMSIIGPRPWIPEYYENFNETQKKRVEVRPGIIGLAQIKGRRNIDVLKKIGYDINYIENINFLLDLKIFFQSIKVIISKEEFLNPNEYIYNEIEILKQNNQK